MPSDRNYASDIAFTDTVKQLQEADGSRRGYASMETGRGWQTAVTDELRQFVAERDMFYLGTANASGQPYIQYRGGPRGFLQVLDDKTLGFADFGGNRQFISTGNVIDNPKAFLFLIDYEHSRRIKIWGRMKVVDDDAELLARLTDTDYPGRAERAVAFSIEAWDVNCPQHIHPRVLKHKADAEIQQLKARIAELEAQLG